MPGASNQADPLAIAAFGVSMVSFLVSAATLYFAHMRSARISMQVGPKFKVYYADGKALSFYFPVTFFNRAQKIGAIASLEFILVGPEGQEFHFPWRSFSMYDGASNNWKYRDLVKTMAVPGASTFQEMIWFSWPLSSAVQPGMPAGVHDCRFRYKILPSGKFREISERFIVSEQAAARLQKYLDEGRSTTVDLDIG